MNRPNKPWTLAEIDRAKRARDIMIECFVQGIPAGHWVAIKLMTGRGDGKAYPTKQAAVEHQPDPDACAYILLPHDGVVEWQGVACALRHQGLMQGTYRSDPTIHLVTPNTGIMSGDHA